MANATSATPAEIAAQAGAAALAEVVGANDAHREKYSIACENDDAVSVRAIMAESPLDGHPPDFHKTLAVLCIRQTKPRALEELLKSPLIKAAVKADNGINDNLAAAMGNLAACFTPGARDDAEESADDDKTAASGDREEPAGCEANCGETAATTDCGEDADECGGAADDDEDGDEDCGDAAAAADDDCDDCDEDCDEDCDDDCGDAAAAGDDDGDDEDCGEAAAAADDGEDAAAADDAAGSGSDDDDKAPPPEPYTPVRDPSLDSGAVDRKKKQLCEDVLNLIVWAYAPCYVRDHAISSNGVLPLLYANSLFPLPSWPSSCLKRSLDFSPLVAARWFMHQGEVFPTPEDKAERVPPANRSMFDCMAFDARIHPWVTPANFERIVELGAPPNYISAYLLWSVREGKTEVIGLLRKHKLANAALLTSRKGLIIRTIDAKLKNKSTRKKAEVFLDFARSYLSNSEFIACGVTPPK